MNPEQQALIDWREGCGKEGISHPNKSKEWIDDYLNKLSDIYLMDNFDQTQANRQMETYYVER